MSSLRKLERDIIRSKCYKQNGNTNNFKKEWDTYRTSKFGEVLPVNTMPKKKRFLDNKDNFISALRYQKAKVEEYFESLKKDKEVENTESVVE